MYIRLEMSVAFIASPNLFNILVVGIRDEIRSEFAIKCWKSIRNKIVLTPVHYISNLFSEVENILHFMKDIKVDCSSIRKMVIKVIEDVKMFIHIKSLPSPMMTSV
jgi:hypothetical protein